MSDACCSMQPTPVSVAAKFMKNIDFVIINLTYLHFDSDDDGGEIGAERPEHHKS